MKHLGKQLIAGVVDWDWSTTSGGDIIVLVKSCFQSEVSFVNVPDTRVTFSYFGYVWMVTRCDDDAEAQTFRRAREIASEGSLVLLSRTR
jgi:hypothetical protein